MWINSKLLAFQKASLSIKKDSENPHFKSKYAALPDIILHINPTLSELWLVVSNSITEWSIVTEIIDAESGEKISASFPLFGTKPQEFGSSITYARRYNLGALLNLHIDDDDDGNEANKSSVNYSKRQESGTQWNWLLDAIEAMKSANTIEELKELFEEGKKLARTEKQAKWLEDEKEKAKRNLLSAESVI